MRVRITDLHLALAATLSATLIEVFVGHTPVVGVVCGLALALVLPGYAFVAAAFAPEALRRSERLLMTLGMSIALTILGGLALNLIPFGLQAFSWSLLLGSVTLIALLIAVIRRHGIPLAGHGSLGSRLRPAQVALLGGALALVVAAGIVSSLGAAAQYAGSAAQLWMLPGAVVNGQQTITIGIDNLEATPLQATIFVEFGDQVIGSPQAVALDAGAHWQTTITAPMVSGTDAQLLEVQLIGSGVSTSLTRHVSLWIAPSPTEAAAATTR